MVTDGERFSLIGIQNGVFNWVVRGRGYAGLSVIQHFEFHLNQSLRVRAIQFLLMRLCKSSQINQFSIIYI
jgi:hypothetical protein